MSLVAVGVGRAVYSSANRDTDPRPSGFKEPALYLEWVKRADSWAESFHKNCGHMYASKECSQSSCKHTGGHCNRCI